MHFSPGLCTARGEGGASEHPRLARLRLLRLTPHFIAARSPAPPLPSALQGPRAPRAALPPASASAQLPHPTSARRRPASPPAPRPGSPLRLGAVGPAAPRRVWTVCLCAVPPHPPQPLPPRPPPTPLLRRRLLHLRLLLPQPPPPAPGPTNPGATFSRRRTSPWIPYPAGGRAPSPRHPQTPCHGPGPPRTPTPAPSGTGIHQEFFFF